MFHARYCVKVKSVLDFFYFCLYNRKALSPEDVFRIPFCTQTFSRIRGWTNKTGQPCCSNPRAEVTVCDSSNTVNVMVLLSLTSAYFMLDDFHPDWYSDADNSQVSEFSKQLDMHRSCALTTIYEDTYCQSW